jgi:hypothetical protein
MREVHLMHTLAGLREYLTVLKLDQAKMRPKSCRGFFSLKRYYDIL